ncbi:MAG: spiro-SPASM protein [Spirochaetes bacterium]|nr:spiro-SPASM protein [Spirochaetota bacterium]
MKNLLFINCIGLSEYAFKKLPSGKTSFETVIEYSKTVPECNNVYILCLEKEKEKYQKLAAAPNFHIISLENWDSSLLFQSFMQSDYKNIFYIYGDTPFLDPDLTKRIYNNHEVYSAQYSFSDGGPYGIAVEIIATEIADALKVLSDKEKLPIKRDTIFTIIQRDINSFDIETHLTEKDLRMLRITFAADSKRNFMILENFDKAEIKGENRIINISSQEEEMLRTVPAFYEIQISGKCFQSCTFCPYPIINPGLLNSADFMSFENFSIILSKVSDFSEDAVISLSLWGEPSAHPDIEKIILKTLEYEKFTLLIETSGIGWKTETIKMLSEKVSNKEKIIWILSLDSDNREIYKSLRGEGFEKAIGMIETLIEYFPDTTYIQAVRMNENESVLEKYYKSWKAKGRKVIVQKYDNFCEFLPDRKVTDISPLRRIPCWHLKRDVPILYDGTVPLCREDVENKNVLGNIFSDTLEEIWNNGMKYYKEHLAQQYNGICRKCDEYYTYNF